MKIRDEKSCQLDKTDKACICGKVLKRTGHRHGVSLSLCDKCSDKIVEEMCRYVKNYHESQGENRKLKAPYKELTIIEMTSNFAKAMKRAAKEHFKRVNKEEFIERQMCCTTCGSGNRCYYCGCLLGVKSWLNSERGCPNPITYPNLKEYPSRNFWEVCKETTSVIIPARNEPYLNRTIESLLKNKTGKVEIIVILDGYKYDVVEDNNVRVIYHESPLGRRISINEAAKIAEGKYLFIIDAHCTMSEGWDTKLKCACGKRDLVVSLIQAIDKNTWKPEPGMYSFVSLNQQLQEKWWENYKKKEDWKVIEEMMAFTGCAWIIRKDYYLQLGGYDEGLNEYGYDGPEWALKVWLHSEYPGKVLLRTDVVCGHVFGTNDNSRLYEGTMLTGDSFYSKMKALWGNKIYNLVDRFAPVPGWDNKGREEEKKEDILKIERKEESVTKDKEGRILKRVTKYFLPTSNKDEEFELSKIEVEELIGDKLLKKILIPTRFKGSDTLPDVILTTKEWDDSQTNELEFWKAQREQDNLEQKQRNIYYQGVLESGCRMFENFFKNHLLEKEVLIDVGGGPKGILHSIKGRRKIAVDPLMNRFRKLGYNVNDNGVEFVELKGEEVSKLGQIADVVFCFNTLDHTQNPKLVIEEIYKVLKPNGHLLILTDMRRPNELDVYHKISLSKEFLMKNLNKFKFVDIQEIPHGKGNPIMQFVAVCRKDGKS